MIKEVNTTDTQAEKKITGFKILNYLILLAFFICGGPFLLAATLGITAIFIIPHILSTVLCPLFYEHFKKNGTKKTPLTICRLVSVLTFVIIYISPIIGAGFTNSRGMYLPKRQVFVYGVRTSANDVLPHKLPKNISEYYFRTGLQMPAQDYHPYADLLFRCGTESIDGLISEVENRGMKKTAEGSPEGFKDLFDGDEEYEKQIMSDKDSLVSVTCKYLDIPNAALYQLDTDSIRHFAEHGVSYGSGFQGCAFDREAGYAVYWG